MINVEAQPCNNIHTITHTHYPELLQLDENIEYFYNIYSDRDWIASSKNTIQNHHNQFISALLDLKNEFFSIQLNYPEKYNAHEDVVKKINMMLGEFISNSGKNAKSPEEKAERNAKTFQKNEAAIRQALEPLSQPKFSLFIRAVSAVILSALSYFSVIGALYIYAKGDKPLNYMKQICGFDANVSLHRHLMFKPSPMESKVEKLLNLSETEQEQITESYSIRKYMP